MGRVYHGPEARRVLRRLLLAADGTPLCRWRNEPLVDRRSLDSRAHGEGRAEGNGTWPHLRRRSFSVGRRNDRSGSPVRRHPSHLREKPLPPATPENLFPPNNGFDFFRGAHDHPFRFEAKRFELVNAWWLAEASLLAYSNDDLVAAR